MPINNIYQARIFCRQAPVTSVNVRHWVVNQVNPPEPTDAEYAFAVSNHLGTALTNCISSSALYAGLTLQKIFPLPVAGAFAATNSTGPGTRPGDTLPPQVAGLISLRSNLVGRRRRGRMYIPFPVEGDNEPPFRPTAPYLALLGLLGDRFTLAINVAGAGGGSAVLLAIVWSRTENTGIDITSRLIRDTWATVRKRSEFRGPDAEPPV